MPTWVTALVVVVQRVVLPLAGTWGILFDRPLAPLPAAIYVVMMGLLPASLLERYLGGPPGSTAARPGDTQPPAPAPPTRSAT